MKKWTSENGRLWIKDEVVNSGCFVAGGVLMGLTFTVSPR